MRYWTFDREETTLLLLVGAAWASKASDRRVEILNSIVESTKAAEWRIEERKGKAPGGEGA